jgi:hypothetical protein
LSSSGANSILGVKSAPLDPTPNAQLVCTLDPSLNVYRGAKLVALSQATPTGQLTLPAQDLITRIKQEIYTNGPVTAGFTVYNSFYEYTSGVIRGGSGGIAGGHAVVIVGWGADSEGEYWIVRNSWASSWGIGGYFNIDIAWTPPDAKDQDGNPTLGILAEVWTISVN